MTGRLRVTLLASLAAASALVPAAALLAQNAPPPDHPAVTVKGQTYTPRSILARNMGTDADQTSQFPPHKVIGNIYYVGTRTLSSYLITTPQGHILINSTYERNVPVIQKSVADLGFKFSDIKILLGTHAHGDHQEGDAAVKQATGAQVMVMEQDVPALAGDQARRQGASRSTGRSTTARRSSSAASRSPRISRRATRAAAPPGPCRFRTAAGPTTSSSPAACARPARSRRRSPPSSTRTFPKFRALPCDVPLGDHPAQYNMIEKHAKLASGGANPFIDPANCTVEADIQEAMFKATLAEQQSAAK